jgi:hypothetical protein
MFVLGVCWRLIGMFDASVLHAPVASLFSSCGVCVFSLVNRIENVDEPAPDADELLPPELEHALNASAHAPMPAATYGSTRRGRLICLVTSNPFFDEDQALPRGHGAGTGVPAAERRFTHRHAVRHHVTKDTA